MSLGRMAASAFARLLDPPPARPEGGTSGAASARMAARLPAPERVALRRDDVLARCYGLLGMTKTELYDLVDALPEESLPAAAILLRRAQDPVVAKLDAAPYDDEELTEEDLRAVRKARSETGIASSDAEAELNAG